MKRLFSTLLATVAICACVSATPVAAQETITGAPKGEAPVTAEPPSATGSGYGASNGPLGVAGAIVPAPFDALTGAPAQAGQSDARCHVTRDFYGFQGRYTAVCNL